MNEFQKNVQAGPEQLGYMVSRHSEGVQDTIQGGLSSLLFSRSPPPSGESINQVDALT